MTALRLSTKLGSAGDSLVGTPDTSLGKYMSTSILANNNLHNLFDEIQKVEAEVGDTEYRCFFILNDIPSSPLSNLKLWIASQVEGGANISIGLDPAGIKVKASGPAQAQEIANESTAPSGVTFSLPTTPAMALVAGTVGPDECLAVWVRRVVPVEPRAILDGAKLTIRWVVY